MSRFMRGYGLTGLVGLVAMASLVVWPPIGGHSDARGDAGSHVTAAVAEPCALAKDVPSSTAFDTFFYYYLHAARFQPLWVVDVGGWEGASHLAICSHLAPHVAWDPAAPRDVDACDELVLKRAVGVFLTARAASIAGCVLAVFAWAWSAYAGRRRERRIRSAFSTLGRSLGRSIRVRKRRRVDYSLRPLEDTSSVTSGTSGTSVGSGLTESSDLLKSL